MKRGVIILLAFFLLIFASSVHAEKVWYTGWVYSGDTFEVEDNIYYVNYFEYGRFDFENNKILLKENNVGMVLKLDKDPDDELCTKVSEEPATNGTCIVKTDPSEFHCVIKDLKKYCIISIDYSPSRVKYLGGEEYPGLHIKISEFKPTVTASAKIEPGTMDKLDEAYLTFEIKNTGDERVNGVNFKYTLPDDIKIFSWSKLERYGHRFQWKGSLMPGKSITLKIRFQVLDYMTESTKANVSYTYQDIYYELSPGVTIKVPTPYTFIDSLSPSSDVIEQLTTYKYTIKNNDASSKMYVSMRTKIPWGLDLITKTPALIREDDYLIFEDEILPEKSKSLEATLRGHYTGEYNISTYGTLTLKDEEFHENTYKTYRITTRKLNPVIRTSLAKVESGDPITIKVLLYNDNKEENYVNIKGKVYCDLLDKVYDVSVDELIIQDNKLVLDKEVITPVSNKAKTVDVIFNGTYEIASGEEYDFSTKKSFTITPVEGERFALTQTPSVNMLEKGEEMTVTVYVENLKPVMVSKVEMHEEITSGVDVVGGIIKKTMALDDYEKKKAYIYKLYVPVDFAENHFEIKSLLNYQDYDLEVSKVINLTEPINETDIEVNVSSPEEPDEPDEPVEPLPKPEKESWWDKLVGWFEKLFS